MTKIRSEKNADNFFIRILKKRQMLSSKMSLIHPVCRREFEISVKRWKYFLRILQNENDFGDLTARKPLPVGSTIR